MVFPSFQAARLACRELPAVLLVALPGRPCEVPVMNWLLWVIGYLIGAVALFCLLRAGSRETPAPEPELEPDPPPLPPEKARHMLDNVTMIERRRRAKQRLSLVSDNDQPPT